MTASKSNIKTLFSIGNKSHVRVVDFLAHRYVRNDSKQYIFQGFRTTFSDVLYSRCHLCLPVSFPVNWFLFGFEKVSVHTLAARALFVPIFIYLFACMRAYHICEA